MTAHRRKNRQWTRDTLNMHVFVAHLVLTLGDGVPLQKLLKGILEPSVIPVLTA